MKEITSRPIEIFVMKKALIAILYYFFMVPVAFAQPIDGESKALVDRGWVLENEGKYDEALSLYDQALELDSNNYLAYKHRGTVNIRMKNYDQAEREFAKAIDLAPNHASTYYNRGLMYYEMGEYDKSVSDYSRAIELEPHYANALMNRAAAYLKKGDLVKASADYRRYVQFNPHDKSSYPAQWLQSIKKYTNLMVFLGITIVFGLTLNFLGIKWGAKSPVPILTEPQKEEIKTAFKEKQKMRNMLVGIMVAFFAIVLYNKDLNNLKGDELYSFFMVFFSVLIMYSILVFRIWRCPWCNKCLGQKIYGDSCPHCSVKLR